MKKKINLNELKVKSFVTKIEDENYLKGGSGLPCLSINMIVSICFDECEEK